MGNEDINFNVPRNDLGRIPEQEKEIKQIGKKIDDIPKTVTAKIQENGNLESSKKVSLTSNQKKMLKKSRKARDELQSSRKLIQGQLSSYGNLIKKGTIKEKELNAIQNKLDQQPKKHFFKILNKNKGPQIAKIDVSQNDPAQQSETNKLNKIEQTFTTKIKDLNSQIEDLTSKTETQVKLAGELDKEINETSANIKKYNKLLKSYDLDPTEMSKCKENLMHLVKNRDHLEGLQRSLENDKDTELYNANDFIGKKMNGLKGEIAEIKSNLDETFKNGKLKPPRQILFAKFPYTKITDKNEIHKSKQIPKHEAYKNMDSKTFIQLWKKQIVLQDKPDSPEAKKGREELRLMMQGALDNITPDGKIDDEARAKLEVALRPSVFMDKVKNNNKKEYSDLRSRIQNLYDHNADLAYQYMTPNLKISKETVFQNLNLFNLSNTSDPLQVHHAHMEKMEHAVSLPLDKFKEEWKALSSTQKADRATERAFLEGCLNDRTPDSLDKLRFIFEQFKGNDKSFADRIFSRAGKANEDYSRLFNKIIQNKQTLEIFLQSDFKLDEQARNNLKALIIENTEFAATIASMSLSKSISGQNADLLEIIKEAYKDKKIKEANLAGFPITESMAMEQAIISLKGIMNNVANQQKISTSGFKIAESDKTGPLLKNEKAVKVFEELVTSEESFTTNMKDLTDYGKAHWKMLGFENPDTNARGYLTVDASKTPTPLQTMIMTSQALWGVSELISQELKELGKDLNSEKLLQFFKGKRWEKYTALTEEYARNYDQGTKELQRLAAKNNNNKIAIQNILEGKKLTLGALLVTPVQRVPRWQLLLAEMQKQGNINTPFDQIAKGAALAINTHIAFAEVEHSKK